MNLTKVLKQNIAYILFTILMIIIICSLYFDGNDLFLFDYNNNSNSQIISHLHESHGFFSCFHFMLNHIVYCKKNGINFDIQSDKWLYKYKDGWTDYFEPYSLRFNNMMQIIPMNIGHPQIIEKYLIKDYKEVIPEVYRYNTKTANSIYTTKKSLGLLDQEYDSIYIRRGDKLKDESKYYKGDTYIEILIEKNPGTKVVFVQTDDYTSIEEIQAYIDTKSLNITIKTTCKPEQRGMVVENVYLNMRSVIKENISYVKSQGDYKNKTIEDMSPDEKYEHMIEILTGVDILANSNICVTDYQSNVARFVKLFHKHSENVYDIRAPNTDIDYNGYGECQNGRGFNPS